MMKKAYRESIVKTIENCASCIIEHDLGCKRSAEVIKDHYANMLRGHYDEISLKEFFTAVQDAIRSFFS